MMFNYTAIVKNTDGTEFTTHNGVNLAKMILWECRPVNDVNTLYILMEDLHETVRQVPLPVKLGFNGKPVLNKDGQVPMKFKEVATMTHMQLSFTDPVVIGEFFKFIGVDSPVREVKPELETKFIKSKSK